MTRFSDAAQLAWDRVYWIGGSPCAGKSTIAHAIAQQFNWQLYHCDSHEQRHRERAKPDQHPTFYKLSNAMPDALWLQPVAKQVERELAYCADQWALALPDLLEMCVTDARPILFEGTSALPTCLAPHLLSVHQAIWVVPTEAFQRQHHARREWAQGVVAQTSEPVQAYENWMQRDAVFAQVVAAQARQFGQRVLLVDGSFDVVESTARVVDHFDSSF